jgi:hypothetical protein
MTYFLAQIKYGYCGAPNSVISDSNSILLCHHLRDFVKNYWEMIYIECGKVYLDEYSPNSAQIINVFVNR